MSIYKLSLRDNQDRIFKEHAFDNYEKALKWGEMTYQADADAWINIELGFGKRGQVQVKGMDILLIEKLEVL